MEVKGQCIFSLKYKNKTVKALFLISPNDVKPIVGRNLSEKLELVKKVFTVEQSKESDSVKEANISLKNCVRSTQIASRDLDIYLIQ